LARNGLAVEPPTLSAYDAAMISIPADSSTGICSPLPGARPDATGYTPRSWTQYFVCDASQEGMPDQSESSCQPAEAVQVSTGAISSGMMLGSSHSHIRYAWSKMSTVLTSPARGDLLTHQPRRAVGTNRKLHPAVALAGGERADRGIPRASRLRRRVLDLRVERDRAGACW
jgi:hypothetical protein